MKKIVLSLITILTLSSCVTKIGDLKANPKEYAGQVVTVSGEVTKVVKIPFTDYSFIELRDSSDDILVFTLSDYRKKDIITTRTEVVSYDSSRGEESTLKVIKALEGFFIENNIFDKDSVKKPAKTIGKFISKSLNALEATYFLIEVNN